MFAAFSSASAAQAATIQWDEVPEGSGIWEGTYKQESSADDIAIKSALTSSPGPNALAYSLDVSGSQGNLAAVKSWGLNGTSAIIIGEKGKTQSIVIDVTATGSGAQGQGVMSYNANQASSGTNQQSDVTLN